MKNIFLVVIMFFAVFVLIVSDFGKGQTVRYDCRDAHWMPDVPVDVKKECDRIMYERWKQQQEQSKKNLIDT